MKSKQMPKKSKKTSEQGGDAGAGAPETPGANSAPKNGLPEHHPLLAPSSFPALQKCSHFIPSGEPSEYTERGNRVHNLSELLIGGKVTGNHIAREDVESATWMAAQTKEILDVVEGCAKRVEVRDPLTGELITYGRLDCWGYEDELPCVIDWKTGLIDDYRPQVIIYALGLMDELEVDVVKGVILFGDQKHSERFLVTRGVAEKLLADTMRRQADSSLPFVVNPRCSWCGLRKDCPAWKEPASEALLTLGGGLEIHLEDGLAEIKKDPVKLSKFLDGWRKAEKLVKEASLTETAINMIEAGTDVPGWYVQERKAKREYSADSVRTLLLLQDQLSIDDLVPVFKVIPDEVDKLFEGKRCPIEQISKGTFKVLAQRKP